MKKPPIIHPFLFAIFPILALYTRNARQVPLSLDIGLLLILPLISSLILFLFMKLLIKDPYRGAFLVSMIIMWFFSFGRIAEKLKQKKIWSNDEALFIATVLFLAIIFIFVIRSKRNYSRLTTFLNIIAFTLVAYNTTATARILLRKVHFSESIPEVKNAQSGQLPNIFFVVLDAYGRADILSEIYKFDNSTFIHYLEQKGFYIASQSPANYCQTYLSLACTLNLTYLDELAAKEGSGSSDRQPLFRMIQDSQVRRLLKTLGYSFVSISSGYSPTEIRDADLFVHFKGLYSEFVDAFLDTTPIPMFLYESRNLTEFDFHRMRVLDSFQTLSSFRYEKSPYFVMAHIVSPHPPFVFGKNGEDINPGGEYFLEYNNDLNWADETKIQEYIARYRDQLSFINKKVIEMVDSILVSTQAPTIIILQSDHGPKAYFNSERADAAYLREAMAVLNAVYIPGGDYLDFYPGMSPVNTFIALINRISGGNKPFLEDKSFYSTWNHPYDFILFDPRTYSKTLSSVHQVKRPEP